MPAFRAARWVERLRREEALEARSSIRFMSKRRTAATARSAAGPARSSSRRDIVESGSEQDSFEGRALRRQPDDSS